MKDPLSSIALAFIGGGNMARSLIGGLLACGLRPAQITVADPVPSQLEALQAGYAVRTTQDNVAAARDADAVVFAVKPQHLHKVAAEVSAAVAGRSALLISIAAGVRASDIRHWLGGTPVVRCMPNRPALHGCGITALYSTADIPNEHRDLAGAIMSAVGEICWLEREADMDAATAISGSGPAYFFLLIEMLEQAGRSLGLSAEVSRKLAVETAYGAGSMARKAGESAATLREQVTSAGGTTEAALKLLEARNVRAIFDEAIAAAAHRSAQLADELGR